MSINVLWLIDALMMMINLPSGSMIDVLWTNGMVLLTKIEAPLCLLLYVDENILSYCLILRYCFEFV